MAQDFRRFTNNNVGTGAATVFTANSFDAIIGISLSNVSASEILVSAYVNDGSNDIYLIKDAPIPAGSSLQVIDGGAKVVVQNEDVLYVVSNTASSLDSIVSVVDAIST